AANFDDIQIIATAGSVAEGVEAMNRERPDLLFLDVEMPDGNGFDLLKKISPVNFRLIFVTGHQEYALDAIKVSALDYVLKPIDNDELIRAIEKAREAINQKEQNLKLQALSENLQCKKVLKRIILHTADHLQLVAVDDIIRAEADSNYTLFRLSGNRKIMVSRTIKEFVSLLANSGFIRVHQSHLVNLVHIDRFMKKDGGWLRMRDGSSVPVSPNLKKQVLQAIQDHMYE
ncbi:MAG TPA: LytTR family DNA-binding domain-containing protein, partial [Bacteroidales bacterium]|nr:LytTR family DNA-binding domain-containing protein [Bacteroidales bacterium]